MVSPESTCFYGMQQSEEGWCDGLSWADQRPYHWPLLHQWKCHRASVHSATTAEGVASPASYHGEEEECVVFQHDGASAHYETCVRAWLDRKLEDRWIGRGGPIPWPA